MSWRIPRLFRSRRGPALETRAWPWLVLFAGVVAVGIGCVFWFMKFRVRIAVEPGNDAKIDAIRDNPPAGWTVSNITHGGTFDSASGTVTFGPFDDGRRRVLGYQVTVPENAFGPQTFSGAVIVDAVESPIGGDKVIGLAPRFLERQISAGRPVEN